MGDRWPGLEEGSRSGMSLGRKPRAGLHSRAMKGRRVLLIDDDEDVRAMVRRLYERNDAEVIEASSGTEGLKALYGMRPDLVLLDISMPELDGWRLLNRIRELTDVPILMLTASDQELAKGRALRAGGD